MVKTYFKILFIVLCTLFTACKPKDDPTTPRTLIFYYPYASNLQSYFRTNIADMKSVVTARGGLTGQRLVVLYSTSATTATLYEMRCVKGNTELYSLEEYTSLNSASPEGFSRILSDIRLHAPAERYSMVIGAHGLGWVPADETTSVQARRWFGGVTAETRMEIGDFARCLRDADVCLEFLLFDCCYMATVEVCYELRDVADRIIATTSELMGPGMPYSLMGSDLLGEPDYACLTRDFLAFYTDYRTPCGTLAVIASEGLDSLAAFTRDMLATHYADPGYLRTAQVLDGYTPPLFYDYGDSMTRLHLTDEELSRLDSLLAAAVPYAVHTPTYYSAYTNRRYTITSFSGLTTSAWSLNSQSASWSNTSWAIAVQ